MRTIILILLAISLNACAHTGVHSDAMQPDGSYRIITSGNAYANHEDAKKTAMLRALGLCPNGYDVLSEIPASQGFRPIFTYIIKCVKN